MMPRGYHFVRQSPKWRRVTSCGGGIVHSSLDSSTYKCAFRSAERILIMNSELIQTKLPRRCQVVDTHDGGMATGPNAWSTELGGVVALLEMMPRRPTAKEKRPRASVSRICDPLRSSWLCGQASVNDWNKGLDQARGIGAKQTCLADHHPPPRRASTLRSTAEQQLSFCAHCL